MGCTRRSGEFLIASQTFQSSVRELLSFYHTIAPGQTDVVSFIYPISAVQSMLNGMTRIKADIRSASGTDLIWETRKPAAIVNELMNLVKRAGTIQSSLFAKVSLVFSCKLPKVSYFQNFLLTRLDFCGNLYQQFNITYFYIFVQTLRG